MGQYNTLLLTREIDHEMPSGIPYFIKDGVMVIGLEHEQFGALLYWMSETGATELSLYEHKIDFLELARLIGLKSYIFFHESDWSGVPDNYYEAAVVDNKLIFGTIASTSSLEWLSRYPTKRTPNAFELLNIPKELTGDYHDYNGFLGDVVKYGPYSFPDEEEIE